MTRIVAWDDADCFGKRMTRIFTWDDADGIGTRMTRMTHILNAFGIIFLVWAFSAVVLFGTVSRALYISNRFYTDCFHRFYTDWIFAELPGHGVSKNQIKKSVLSVLSVSSRV